MTKRELALAPNGAHSNQVLITAVNCSSTSEDIPNHLEPEDKRRRRSNDAGCSEMEEHQHTAAEEDLRAIQEAIQSNRTGGETFDGQNSTPEPASNCTTSAFVEERTWLTGMTRRHPRIGSLYQAATLPQPLSRISEPYRPVVVSPQPSNSNNML